MEKLLLSVCFLAVCFLISDSSCLDMFKSRSAKKFSLFKSRQSFNNFKKRSFLGDEMNVRGKPEGKKEDPPPPPVSDVWGALGISREDFMKKHKDYLTAEVRIDIKNQMMENIQKMKAGMEYWARVISCSIMHENEPPAKRTVDDTEGQVERNITEVEEQEENALQALLATFGVNETNLEETVQGLPIPKSIVECEESPLIMKTGNEMIDKEQTLTICGRLLLVNTIKKMAENSDDTMESFMNSFEEFLKGTLTFFRMYYLSTEVTDDEITRMLKENKLHELKRFLQDAIADLTFRK